MQHLFKKVVVPLVKSTRRCQFGETSDIEEALKQFGLYVEQISRGKARPLVKILSRPGNAGWDADV